MPHGQRIMRNYRNMPPTKFHGLNQRVSTSVADEARVPGTTWMTNPSLISSYLAVSQKHDAVYHEAMLGSKLVIAEREVLQAQIIIYLDEIAAILEAAAVRNSDILLASGFDLVKERRGRTRAKTPAAEVNSAHADHETGDAN